LNAIRKDDDTVSMHSYTASIVGSKFENLTMMSNISNRESIALEKLMRFQDNIVIKDSFIDVFDEILEKTTHIFECQKISLFVLHDEVQKL